MSRACLGFRKWDVSFAHQNVQFMGWEPAWPITQYFLNKYRSSLFHEVFELTLASHLKQNVTCSFLCFALFKTTKLLSLLFLNSSSYPDLVFLYRALVALFRTNNYIKIREKLFFLPIQGVWVQSLVRELDPTCRKQDQGQTNK